MCLLHLLRSYLYLRWWLDCAADPRGAIISCWSMRLCWLFLSE
ncbi:hypothetical protein T12_5329 [Trichinella patagoniensis]|uniref:Uncharacterized protein n=1 Tax=Trichinella patagoniensis TaxID=990121 RepID=A0A0V0W2C0_9BILA|nr:hypothetical protein T12_5329 [Trichinella patagoniensis]